jgi:hypothetical protein
MHDASWEGNNEEEPWAKINTDRKRWSYIEKDCFAKSQNYCSTGDNRIEDPVSTKIIVRELHEVNIHDRAAISKPEITENIAHMRRTS